MNAFKISDLLNRRVPPTPWEEYEKIPWNDPTFSERMLKNHLSQDHDWASRRTSIIEQQLNWIKDHLPQKGAKILDLGCGPGLYTQKLAKMGYRCTGVDFSPASIAFAKQQALDEKLEIHYICEDIRRFSSIEKFDLVLFSFGEINVFQKSEAFGLIKLAFNTLNPGGIFINEVHTFNAVKEIGETKREWMLLNEGLFSDKPHLSLQENFWDPTSQIATSRYYIIDTETYNVTPYGSSVRAYTDQEYSQLFKSAGFSSFKILSENQWPSGEIFSNKLQTFVCSIKSSNTKD